MGRLDPFLTMGKQLIRTIHKFTNRWSITYLEKFSLIEDLKEKVEAIHGIHSQRRNKPAYM